MIYGPQEVDLRLEVDSSGSDEFGAVASARARTVIFRPAAAASGTACVLRQSRRFFSLGGPWRAAGARHRRLLQVLAYDRHSPAYVVEHADRWRCRGIYRARQGTVDRLPVRARDPGADLSRLFPDHHRG